MTKARQKPFKLPYEVDEYISGCVVALEKALKKECEGLYSLTILYRNPRLDGDFHFMPLGEQEQNIGGPSGEYFKTFCRSEGLEKMRPTEPDIQGLLDRAMNCPYAAAAAKSLLEQNIHADLELDDPLPSQRRLLEAALKLFVDPKGDKATRILEHLYTTHHLQQVLHTALLLVPQYPTAKGAVMYDKKHDPIDGIRWYGIDDKVEHWQETCTLSEGGVKPATTLFFLLSAIESLKWHDDSLLGCITNLCDYLAPNGTPGIAPRLSFPLRSLSAYVNVSEEVVQDDEKKSDFSTVLANTLKKNLDVLRELSKSIVAAMWERDSDLLDGLRNWRSEVLVNGVLSYLGPDSVSYAETYSNGGKAPAARRRHRIRNKLKDVDVYTENKADEPSLLVQCMADPWGLYADVTSLGAAIPAEGLDRKYALTCYPLKEWLHFLSSTNYSKIFLSAKFGKPRQVDEVRRAKLIVGEALRELHTESCHDGLDLKVEWYRRTFGEFYRAFDEDRHKPPAPGSLPDKSDPVAFQSMRRNMLETNYYLDRLQEAKRSLGPDRPLRVLDVGIGYGRLAEKLLANMGEEIDISGLDVSLYMRDQARKRLSQFPWVKASNIRLGEMRDVGNLFPESSQDVVIVAFTTFGCYQDDDDADDNRATLRGIFRVLKPGGTLIIEQFNPHKYDAEEGGVFSEKVYERVLLVGDDPSAQRHIRLLKTTKYVRGHEDYTTYTGDFFYHLEPPTGTDLLRRDPYLIRLYHQSWFETALKDSEFENVRVGWDFGDGPGPQDATFMTCQAARPTEVDPETYVSESGTHAKCARKVVATYRHFARDGAPGSIKKHLKEKLGNSTIEEHLLKEKLLVEYLGRGDVPKEVIDQVLDPKWGSDPAKALATIIAAMRRKRP